MKIAKMTDEQALAKFVEFLETRISITTGFAMTKEKDDTITHQFLKIRCGDLEVVSQPEKLESPLRLATGAELGVAVN